MKVSSFQFDLHRFIFQSAREAINATIQAASSAWGGSAMFPPQMNDEAFPGVAAQAM